MFMNICIPPLTYLIFDHDAMLNEHHRTIQNSPTLIEWTIMVPQRLASLGHDVAQP